MEETHRETKLENAGARKTARKHVLLKAEIITAEGTQDARIKDLSASGAQVSCCGRLRADDDVIFRRGSIFAAARVAWTENECAGLEFYRPLGPIAFASSRPT